MEDQENIKQEDKSLEVIVEEYENKLKDMEAKYESRITEINNNHVREIRTLMRTGNSPQAETMREQEEEKPVDEQILDSLRKKYKLN